MPPWSARGRAKTKGPSEVVNQQRRSPSSSISAGRVSPSPHLSDLEEKGDGGKIECRLSEAALERRGNAEVRRRTDDSTRLYLPSEQKQWEQKYKFFSARHMERSYRLFTRARHDPFNKDPSWGQSIIHRVAASCTKRNVAPETLFTGITNCDTSSGNGNLNRNEIKKVVCGALPDLSDEEVTAIFDTIDADKSGDVNIREFCEVVRRGRDMKVNEDHTHRWRNPIHRIRRFAPAQVEGWDHLEGDTKFLQIDKVCDTVQSDMQSRLGQTLGETARGSKKAMASRSRHAWFSGGADCERFRRQQYAKDMAQDPEKAAARITDPGPFPKPGWWTDLHGARFDRLRTPLTAR